MKYHIKLLVANILWLPFRFLKYFIIGFMVLELILSKAFAKIASVFNKIHDKLNDWVVS